MLHIFTEMFILKLSSVLKMVTVSGRERRLMHNNILT